MGKKLEPPSETADQTTNKIEFRHAGKVFKEVKVSQMKMDQWDDVIYERALGTRLPDHYQLFEVCGAA
ncbi:MAG: hypothetical protein DMF07_04035 [Verrucomicrobia bacterium]|nr:MAG: hypothetical protein DMF07_04035 [Verrucomicrobiota bacterium]